jgi:hypothetical protein
MSAEQILGLLLFGGFSAIPLLMVFIVIKKAIQYKPKPKLSLLKGDKPESWLSHNTWRER